jgi:hypothetical protein
MPRPHRPPDANAQEQQRHGRLPPLAALWRHRDLRSTQNQFFQNGTGDRGNALVQAHQIQEGVTPSPDSITPIDITVVVQQYGCLYGFTDKTAELYEDDIPKAMIEQVGERVTLVNEMIIWGALRACTNQYFGGPAPPSPLSPVRSPSAWSAPSPRTCRPTTAGRSTRC